MELGLGMTEPKTLHYGLWDGSSTIICAYALLFILIFVKRKEYPDVFMLFIPSSAILLTLCYFPIVSSALITYMPVGSLTRIQVIRRFRWIIMLLPLLAFGMTYLIRISCRLQRYLISVITIFLLIVSVYGNDISASGLKTGYWNMKNDMDHLYKISNISLSMGDTIMKEQADFFSKDKNNYVSILVGVDDSGGLSGDNRDGEYFTLSLRQYLSPIHYSTISLSDNDYAGYISSNEDYALIPDQEDYLHSFMNAGYVPEWHKDGYCFMNKGTDK